MWNRHEDVKIHAKFCDDEDTDSKVHITTTMLTIDASGHHGGGHVPVDHLESQGPGDL